LFALVKVVMGFVMVELIVATLVVFKLTVVVERLVIEVS